ncbi:MAG: M28 family metallopeptidase [Verrucomicrobiales bacterium]
MKFFPLLCASVLALTLTTPFSGCENSKNREISRIARTPIPESLIPQFDGHRAFAHVHALVEIGPRPPASPGFEKGLVYLEETLQRAGWKTTRQSFRAATPDGPIAFTNLIARHSSAAPFPESTAILLGGHIDTKKLPFPFVGANDSGSSTGVMLEIARVLSTNPEAASQVELVFFDGEEAMRPNITPSDGLYGSKYYAHALSIRPSWPSLGIVLDIVGDPNHSFYYNPECPPLLQEALEKHAVALPFSSTLTVAPGSIIDDHVPLMATGLPCVHLIGDFQSMSYWHQPGDTLDKLSPATLEQVGRLTLSLLSEPPSDSAEAVQK